jgi:uncharacterized OsmC-like protein
VATITVTHQTEDQFRIDVRGHELLVDQHHRDRAEAGPSPTELFVSALAACVGHYAVGFLRRHQLRYDGLRVECDWKLLAAQPARVGRIQLRVTPPEPVPPALRAGLAEEMSHCTVHNSLRHPPPVTVTLTEDTPVPT